MGLFDVVFGTKRKVRIGQNVSDEFLPAGAVELDASINETHNSTAEVTSHPVEDGADITDHVRVKPETLSITGVVTNHPLIFLASLRESPTRAEEAYGKLRDILIARERISVITSLRQYENMVLTSMQTNRDVNTGNIINVTLNFQEVIIATTESVAAPEPAAGAGNAGGAANAGKQGAADAGAAGGGAKQSLLKAGLGAIGGG